ncbi:MAG: hypothetical protein AAFX58_00465 [Pseudomonadota bacterium]
MAQDTRVPDRPYLSTKELDALARMNTELLSELWILRDRVLILEHLLSEAGTIAGGAIDAFEPPEALAEKLRADRDAMVARVAGAAHRQALDVADIRKNA